MRNIAIISSLIYIVASAIYFLFGNNQSDIWITYYYVNNGLYIALLLSGYIFVPQIGNNGNKGLLRYVSGVISAIIFQILFITFQLAMYFSNVDYIKAISSEFWSWIWFVIAVIYCVTLKLLQRWVNG